jgi:8-oxo-dGTP pyrophosphatase MutT (NUDIX family)
MRHEVQADGRVHGVVFGCRRADGRYLMIRRSRNVALPGKVCFPGGGANAGEAQEGACVREAWEELGVCIRPVRPVWRHEFVERRLTLFGWLAEVEEGAEFRLDPMEVEEVLWLSREEAVAHPDGLPTNALFIEALEGALDGWETRSLK